MNQELIDYIKKSKEAGQSEQQIKENLLKTGWDSNDIGEAFGLEPKAPNSWTQISTNPELDKAPKWLLLIFKFYGALLAISATLFVSIVVGLPALTNPQSIISFKAFGIYTNIVYILILSFGCWELKRWVTPLLGVSSLLGLSRIVKVIFIIAGFSDSYIFNIIFFLTSFSLFLLSYFYRQYFSESFVGKKPYVIYIIFVLALTFSYIANLYSASSYKISDAEIDAYSKVAETGVANKIIENGLEGELIQLSPLRNDFYGAEPIKESLIFSPDAAHYSYIISRFATSTR